MTHCACRSRARAGHQTVTGPVTSTCLHDRRGRVEATQTALGEALVMRRRTRVRFPPPPPPTPPRGPGESRDLVGERAGATTTTVAPALFAVSAWRAGSSPPQRKSVTSSPARSATCSSTRPSPGRAVPPEGVPRPARAQRRGRAEAGDDRGLIPTGDSRSQLAAPAARRPGPASAARTRCLRTGP